MHIDLPESSLLQVLDLVSVEDVLDHVLDLALVSGGGHKVMRRARDDEEVTCSDPITRSEWAEAYPRDRTPLTSFHPYQLPELGRQDCQ